MPTLSSKRSVKWYIGSKLQVQFHYTRWKTLTEVSLQILKYSSSTTQRWLKCFLMYAIFYHYHILGEILIRNFLENIKIISEWQKMVNYTYINYSPFCDISLPAVTLCITLTMGKIFLPHKMLTLSTKRSVERHNGSKLQIILHYTCCNTNTNDSIQVSLRLTWSY